MRELLKAVLPGAVRRLSRRCIDTVRARSIWTRMRLTGRVRRPKGSNGTKRLGLLAVRFPPEIGSGVFRPTSFARYAAEAGLHVTVVAARARQRANESGQYLAGHIPAKVVIHRAQPEAQFAFLGALPVLAGGFLDLIDQYRTADNVFRQRPPDVILATGPQFYTFIAAYHLARRYQCPLVLDYRDEWTECPFDFVEASELDRKWERRCLAAARLVIFTTESQRRHAVEVFAELDDDRTAVIPNGWEPRDWAGLTEYEGPDSAAGPRKLSYVGNLGDHRPPNTFLDRIEACLADRPDLREKIRLRFVGPKSPAAEDRLAEFPWPEMLESVDRVTKSEAGKHMRDSSCQLLINSPDMERYIPGKLYEYVAAGPPVLAFGAGGEIGERVSEIGAGWVIDSDDTAALTEVIESIASSSPPPTAPGVDRERWLAEHTREANARRLVELIRPLMVDR